MKFSRKIKSETLSYKTLDKNGKIKPVSKELIELARSFRKNPTRAEKIVWQQLRNRKLKGYKFIRQVPYAGLILDSFCSQQQLAIEIDGDIHSNRYVQCNDKNRQKFLEQNGVRFLRFTNDDVFNNLEFVLESIICFLEKK